MQSTSNEVMSSICNDQRECANRLPLFPQRGFHELANELVPLSLCWAKLSLERMFLLMKLWNVFKMELFKNWHDRTSMFMILIFMCVNTIGGLFVSHSTGSTQFVTTGVLAIIFGFSVFGSVVFTFLYPYRMARLDYRNKVMSLKIASGVSRIQYYFVKVGATLLFSLLSLVALLIVPVFIVSMTHDMAFIFEVAGELIRIDFIDILRTLLIALFMWLSVFAILMTAVIIARGKGSSIFIFFGLTTVTSIITSIIQDAFNLNSWSLWQWDRMMWLMLLQYVITTVVMSLIGILVIRKQDL